MKIYIKLTVYWILTVLSTMEELFIFIIFIINHARERKFKRDKQFKLDKDL